MSLQLEATQEDLRKTHEALESQQSANSQLKLDSKNQQEQIAKLHASLEETTSKLDNEVSSSTAMKDQLSELKMEYIAAGDKLDKEQSHVRQLQSELSSMEQAANTNARDKKAAQVQHSCPSASFCPTCPSVSWMCVLTWSALPLRAPPILTSTAAAQTLKIDPSN